MVNIYLILGQAKSRKSSLVRALSGVGRQGVYKVEITNGTIIRIFIKPTSIQEDKTRMSPNDLIQFIGSLIVSSQKISNFLITLRITSRKRGHAMDFIEKFIKNGYKIKPVIVLDKQINQNEVKGLNAMLNQKKIRAMIIEKPEEKPNNAMTAVIRNLWEWR